MTCTTTNLASRKAAERLGFQFEGVMRSKLIVKGSTRDIASYAMLADEWPARKVALQRWLQPSNFKEGKQRAPLAI